MSGFLVYPDGSKRLVHVVSCGETHVRTSFGTFERKSLRWIVDGRYRLELSDV